MPSPGSRCRLGQRRRRSRVAVMASNRKRSSLRPEDHELEQSGEHHSPPRPSSRYTRSRSRSPTHGSPSPVFDHDLSTADRRSTPNSSSPVMNISPGGPSWWATGGARLTSLILVTFPKFLTLPGARALTPRRGGPLPASLAPGLDPAPEELSPVLSLCVVPPQGGVSVGSRDGSASSLGPVYSGSTGSTGRSTLTAD